MNRIDAWRAIQEVYMAAVKHLVDDWLSNSRRDDDDHAPLVEDMDRGDEGSENSVVRIPAEDVPLFLPSSLPPHLCNDHAMAALRRKEARLRVAIADDSLTEIRRLRRMMVGVAQFKQLNVSGTGQKANTRVRNIYSKFKDKVTLTAGRYRDAYAALLALKIGGGWSDRLRPLLDKDISGPGNEDEGHQLGEGRREVSWIWLVARPAAENDSPEDFNECMQVEWTKTRARARRWEEELELIQEEMRRVLCFFDWKARWWREQGGRRLDVSTALRAGIAAYAAKQTYMYEELALKFQNLWVPFFTIRRLYAQWATDHVNGVRNGATQHVHRGAPARLDAGGETEQSESSEEEDL